MSEATEKRSDGKAKRRRTKFVQYFLQWEERLKRMFKRFITRFCIANDDFEATKVAHEIIRLSEAVFSHETPPLVVSTPLLLENHPTPLCPTLPLSLCLRIRCA